MHAIEILNTFKKYHTFFVKYKSQILCDQLKLDFEEIFDHFFIYLFCFEQFSSLDTPGYVGFANLPNQVHRKSVKKGFEFTLMVVGESGLGKSTLVNSLFLTDLYPERVIPDSIGKFDKFQPSKDDFPFN